MNHELCTLTDTINITNSLEADMEKIGKDLLSGDGSDSEDKIAKNANFAHEEMTETVSVRNEDQFQDTNNENVNIQLLETGSNSESNSSAVSKVNKSSKSNKTSSQSSKLIDLATRPCQFALARIKTIMKMDPDLGLTSKESVFLVAKAAVTNFFENLIFQKHYFI